MRRISFPTNPIGESFLVSRSRLLLALPNVDPGNLKYPVI